MPACYIQLRNCFAKCSAPTAKLGKARKSKFNKLDVVNLGSIHAHVTILAHYARGEDQHKVGSEG